MRPSTLYRLLRTEHAKQDLFHKLEMERDLFHLETDVKLAIHSLLDHLKTTSRSSSVVRRPGMPVSIEGHDES